MTTDITELAQRMRTAARKATPGQWVAFTHADSRTFSVHTPDDNRCGDVIKWAGFDGQRKAKANAEFIALANPANILALVEALEKAQQRISQLESRTVKLPDLRQIVSGDRYVWSDGVYNYSQDVKVALAAAGIKVEAE
ncbi:TPA: ead/Ea22-like family protein [Klebsiella pneumoniae subsp. pneumoniae]|nr:ead/Ea22-like family protein [Klebsiella pneumoniae subsp. pneumoniae]HDY7090734.1 ead/Ea22-like family protein [Klebsiella pneumoniae]HEP0714738.1 ead/Ea22-like family protein [Klebsiella pneumoniae subsp. ozaenae]